MQQHTIRCAFCKGTGNNPHFRGTCSVCKGTGSNQISGDYMVCRDCRGSGQKRGTTLTCYTCSGRGVVPDARAEFKQAGQEIRQAQVGIEKGRTQLAGNKGAASGKKQRHASPATGARTGS